MTKHEDPFYSIDASALEAVSAGAENVAGATQYNAEMDNAVSQVSNVLDQVQQSSGNNQMLMMMMMMMGGGGGGGGGGGHTVTTGGLLGATTVS
jgi:hypothetical protein